MSGVICLRCKQDPCRCVEDASAQLDRAVEQFATLPDAVKEILERLSPLDMAVALHEASVEFLTLTIERDHYREELLKASLIVHALVAEHGHEGSLTMSVDTVNEGHGKMLDYAVEDGWVTVTIEEAPSGSEG